MKRRQFIKAAGTATFMSALGLSQLSKNAYAQILAGSGLKDLYANNFLIGAMVPQRKFLVPEQSYLNIVQRDFNSIVTQNTFKWANVHPSDDEWNWVYTDRFVDFGEKNSLHMVGHPLVGGSQLPDGLFLETPEKLIGREMAIAKMDNHIATLVDRYKGRIHAWDVVNEAFSDDKPGWANTIWHNIIGPDYVARAFAVAREADPEATLIYNDYNLWDPLKRDFAVSTIRDFKASGVPLDAIGMQGHFSLTGPDLIEVEKSIEAFAAEGVRIHFTEVEVDVFADIAPVEVDGLAEVNEPAEFEGSINKQPEEEPEVDASNLDPYRDGLPEKLSVALQARYRDIFSLLLKHADKIDRVALWGVTDDDSWKNDFPIEGRTNYPLLFGRDNQPKPAYFGLKNLKI